jgi:chromate transporter
MALLTVLSFVFVLYGTLAPIAAVVTGLKAVVVALVVQALLRLGRRALKGYRHVLFAAAAFIGLAILKLPFPAIVIAGLLAGPFVFRRASGTSRAGPPRAAPPLGRALSILGGGVALWLLPLGLLALAAAGPLPARLYLFFSQAAILGFGGAYAILAYVNAQLVDVLHWLSPPQMLAGLALAETTPGPLVLVLQFYGFVTGWNAPGGLASAQSALLGSALASWATFLPSFVLVLAGAPYLERVAANARLAAALEAVTAMVVGVIASFALAVVLAVLLPRGLAAPDWVAVVVAAGAGWTLTRSGLSLPWILAGGAGAALAWARLCGA